jgi:hypothetical protein
MAPNVRRKRAKGPTKRRLRSPVASCAGLQKGTAYTGFAFALFLYSNKKILTLAHVNCRGIRSLRVLNVEQVLKMRLNSSW